MQYLHDLKSDLTASFTNLTPSKVILLLENGELPSDSNYIKYIARLVLVDCKEKDPFIVIAWIRQWLQKNGRDVPDLFFSSDIIDFETYDLQIDINLTDKIIFATDDDGNITGDYTECLPPVWSEVLGNFVKGSIANGGV